MELKPCEECGRVSSSEAVECPYCGFRSSRPLPLAPVPAARQEPVKPIPTFVPVAIIAVAVVVVVILFLIQTAPQRRMAANEEAAISALRTLSSAQELYNCGGRIGYGDYCNLYDGKHTRYIKPELAAADPDHPRHQPLNGYTIDISVDAEYCDWNAIARPVKWGIDGKKNFKITSDGVIWPNETEKNPEFPTDKEEQFRREYGQVMREYEEWKKKVAKEATAISALREISDGQEFYNSLYDSRYGDWYHLNVRWKVSRISYGTARADPDHPEHKPLNGYTIDISVNADRSDWCAIARPVRWGVDGETNFKIESYGVICFNAVENSSDFTRDVEGRTPEEIGETRKEHRKRAEERKKKCEERERKEREYWEKVWGKEDGKKVYEEFKKKREELQRIKESR